MMSEPKERKVFSIQEEMGHSSRNQCPKGTICCSGYRIRICTVNNELLKTGITQKSVVYKVAGSLITGKVCVFEGRVE
jgi:hypothetical protein